MGASYELNLSDPAALKAVRSHLAAGGLLLPAAVGEPALFTTVEVRIALPWDASAVVSGQVVNRAPGGGSFVHLAPGAGLDTLKAAAEAAASEPEPEPEEPSGPLRSRSKGPIADSMKPVWELIDPQSDVPLYKQIKALTVKERLRLARQASQPVRRILVRDIDKRVHVELMKCPKITDEEIVEYSAIASLSPRALLYISKQGKYMRRRDVMMNLVTNPATPQDVSFKILDRMNQRELVRVLRSSKAREAVKRQVKRKLMKAGVI